MEKHTEAELKEMCRSRGLKMSGNKRELIDRLAAGDGSAAPSGVAAGEAATQEPPAKRARASGGGSGLTASNIGPKLEALGIRDFSHCAAAAICKGHIRWNGTQEELDQPAMLADGSLLEVSGEYFDGDCEHTWNPTLRSLLEQTDYPGSDYEDGKESATVRCPHEGCDGRLYVTGMCMGHFQEDSGEFHNHCTECKGLGKCMGDYRHCHCSTCGKHYYVTNPCCAE